jgi:hypothetical protein
MAIPKEVGHYIYSSGVLIDLMNQGAFPGTMTLDELMEQDEYVYAVVAGQHLFEVIDEIKDSQLKADIEELKERIVYF